MLDHTSGVERHRAINSHRVISYESDPIVQALSESSVCSRPSSPASTTTRTTPQSEHVSLCRRFGQQDLSRSPTLSLNPSSGSISGGNRSASTARSPQPRPLLNLVWRDVGNGIQRAFPRHEMPTLLPPDLCLGLQDLTKGCRREGVFDEDIVLLDYKSKQAPKPTNADRNYWVAYGEAVYYPPANACRYQDALGLPISEAALESKLTPVISTRTPEYHFVPLPKATPTGPTSVPRNRITMVSSHVKKLTTGKSHNPSSKRLDCVTSNVHPSRLYPPSFLETHRRASTSSSSLSICNPNTSSIFSDTDTNGKDDASDSSDSSIERYRVRRDRLWRERCKNIGEERREKLFGKVAVTHAAERLVTKRVRRC